MAKKIYKKDANGELVQIGVLPTSDCVTVDTAQTITGKKVFSEIFAESFSMTDYNNKPSNIQITYLTNADSDIGNSSVAKTLIPTAFAVYRYGESILTSISSNYIKSSEKGANSGVATLGDDGKIPSSQLPSYVDDVLEYSSKSAFPTTGESGKIYIALDTNLTYRWSGSGYVEISASLALGETSSTAYAGDKGKANATSIANLDKALTADETKISTNTTNIATNTSGISALKTRMASAEGSIDSLGVQIENIIDGTDKVGSAKTADSATSAGKLTTARKITLSGGVSGSGSFDGSGDITISTTHMTGSANSKASGFYKFSTDAYSHIKSVTSVEADDIKGLGFVDTSSDQEIDGIKTFNAPKNIGGVEEFTTVYKTANGGQIVLGKEGTNSGSMLRIDQVAGTCRLRFMASATQGAIVWEQPESGSCLFYDVYNIQFRKCTSIMFTAFTGATYLYTDSNGYLKKGTDALVKATDLTAYAKSDDLATVATSGSYNDLTDKPTIPTTAKSATTGITATASQPSFTGGAHTHSITDNGHQHTVTKLTVAYDADTYTLSFTEGSGSTSASSTGIALSQAIVTGSVSKPTITITDNGHTHTL